MRKPSEDFLSYLATLAKKGITVRMVTTVEIPETKGVTSVTVKPEQISSDRVLIDGMQWYTIGRGARVN